LEDLSSSVLSQFNKYHPSGNLKFYNLGILKCLKSRILVKKILSISLKLNFTPNTLGSKGLTRDTELCIAYPSRSAMGGQLVQVFQRVAAVVLDVVSLCVGLHANCICIFPHHGTEEFSRFEI